MGTVQYKFADETLMVTGASSGIGQLVCEQFAASGGNVVCIGRNRERLDKVVSAINESGAGSAVAVVGDVSQGSTFDEAIEITRTTFGALNYAFNCAGTEGPLSQISDTSDSEFAEMINTKLTGCFLGLRAQTTAMRETGGVIVNMVGSFGHVGYPYMGAYCAAAHGVLGLTRTAALEEGKHNIRVNAVCPGAVETDLLTRMMGGDKDAGLAIGGSTALGRIATPADVAGAVFYLLSDSAQYITGTYIMLDGGV